MLFSDCIIKQKVKYVVMKKKFAILISLFILMLPVFSVCACTWSGANEQNNLVNVIWQTDENDYGIELTFTVLDQNSARYGTLKYEDKEYDIHMGWAKGKVNIDHIGYYGNIVGYANEGNAFEITGNYTIIEKNVVGIKFNNVYGDLEELKSLKDKIITVRASDIDKDEYDVSVINNVMWQSNNLNWKIYTYYGMRRFSVGTYGTGEGKTEVAVFWLADNTFKVYKLKERTPLPSGISHYIDISRIDGNAFMVGTYTNDSKQLHLTYTIEEETQPRISILYCQEIDGSQNNANWYPSSPEAAPLL